MMKNAWKGKSEKSKKRLRDDNAPKGGKISDQNLERIVGNQRKKIDEKKSILPQLKEKYTTTQLKIQELADERRFIRQRRTMEKEVNQLKSTIDRIESGQELKQFEEFIKPYVEAHEETSSKITPAKNEDRKRRRKMRKQTTTKVERRNKRKSTATTRRIRVSTPDKRNIGSISAATTIVDELADELADDEYTPAVYMCTHDTCPECGPGVIMRKLPAESMFACEKCGISMSYLDSTSATSGHDDQRSFPQFSYKKLNHFIQWMKQCQGKEVCNISDAVLDMVCTKLREQQVKPEDVTPGKIRVCLKQLKMRKYYEHVVLIHSMLTGVDAPRFSPSVEAKLETMFLQIQQPFEIAIAAVHPARKNFLSYSYVCFKFCQLIPDFSKEEREQWLSSFQLLKGRDKLYRQDVIFKHMCKTLGWPFYPSV